MIFTTDFGLLYLLQTIKFLDGEEDCLKAPLSNSLLCFKSA